MRCIIDIIYAGVKSGWAFIANSLLFNWIISSIKFLWSFITEILLFFIAWGTYKTVENTFFANNSPQLIVFRASTKGGINSVDTTETITVRNSGNGIALKTFLLIKAEDIHSKEIYYHLSRPLVHLEKDDGKVEIGIPIPRSQVAQELTLTTQDRIGYLYELSINSTFYKLLTTGIVDNSHLYTFNAIATKKIPYLMQSFRKKQIEKLYKKAHDQKNTHEHRNTNRIDQSYNDIYIT